MLDHWCFLLFSPLFQPPFHFSCSQIKKLKKTSSPSQGLLGWKQYLVPSISPRQSSSDVSLFLIQKKMYVVARVILERCTNLLGSPPRERRANAWAADSYSLCALRDSSVPFGWGSGTPLAPSDCTQLWQTRKEKKRKKSSVVGFCLLLSETRMFEKF